MREYPDWMCQSIIEDSLNWNEAKELSFQEFSEKYRLHDSYWIGLFYDVNYDNNLIIAIEWDAVWLPDEGFQSNLTFAGWPFLFIKVEDALQVSVSGYKYIGGVSRSIATAEIEEVNGKHLLVISDQYGGKVAVSFSGKLKFLVVDKDGKVLRI